MWNRTQRAAFVDDDQQTLTVEDDEQTLAPLALAGLGVTRPAIAGLLLDVDDPEIGVDILSLGLIYNIEIGDGQTKITMTVTTPACPLSAYLEDAVKTCLWQLPGVGDVTVEFVYEPAWAPTMMNDNARHMLGWS